MNEKWVVSANASMFYLDMLQIFIECTLTYPFRISICVYILKYSFNVGGRTSVFWKGSSFEKHWWTFDAWMTKKGLWHFSPQKESYLKLKRCSYLCLCLYRNKYYTVETLFCSRKPFYNFLVCVLCLKTPCVHSNTIYVHFVVFHWCVNCCSFLTVTCLSAGILSATQKLHNAPLSKCKWEGCDCPNMPFMC